jgi:hypothetical protein
MGDFNIWFECPRNTREEDIADLLDENQFNWYVVQVPSMAVSTAGLLVAMAMVTEAPG